MLLRVYVSVMKRLCQFFLCLLIASKVASADDQSASAAGNALMIEQIEPIPVFDATAPSIRFVLRATTPCDQRDETNALRIMVADTVTEWTGVDGASDNPMTIDVATAQLAGLQSAPLCQRYLDTGGDDEKLLSLPGAFSAQLFWQCGARSGHFSQPLAVDVSCARSPSDVASENSSSAAMPDRPLAGQNADRPDSQNQH